MCHTINYEGKISKKLLNEVENYIKMHYVGVEIAVFDKPGTLLVDKEPVLGTKTSNYALQNPMLIDNLTVGEANTVYRHAGLDETIKNLEEPFSATLLQLIDASGKKDSEIYSRANIDRRLFSKIRSNASYSPSKRTVLAFAIALELDFDKTIVLLGSAGFTLSRSHIFDVILEFFIRKQRYDLFEINEVLLSYNQPLLCEKL